MIESCTNTFANSPLKSFLENSATEVVVNPTVVGSFADRAAQFRKAMKDPKKMAAAMAVGAAGGKALESGSRRTFKKIQPPAVKGGRAGRRSAGQ